ncbi:hypothetical protein [Dendronalium sp. ChiSLP03b]|uniref:hypothetical protein n=1 Tax=Dendronalium sp. ChiSLP03b TaxID=3075381 RepID=UPI002AD29BA2|nr:hypothetical protein [Dendronalium sp. ChiSLP03b]MDZ8208819.1 hypothetical protein [Dendronalium sp. ChiSLP03b]
MAAQNPDPIQPDAPFKNNTYYQILYVEPSQEKNERITTSILAKTRGNTSNNGQTSNNTHAQSFNQFELDEETINNLENYPRRKKDPKNQLSSYLPSSGVVFPQGFIDSFSKEDQQTELGNFYVPMRTLLHSRKLSQLIAKTWWSYLEAKEKGLQDKFAAGEWDAIDSNILDGLIAREIFLYGGGDAPDNPDPDDPSIYSPLKPKERPSEKARFLILPSSRAWQGISLSLLLAGQAYYKRGDKYHQISQPILSTGEITIQYSLEVDWNRLNGDIKEIIISQEKPWVAYQVVIPYPTIPADAEQENIHKWAYAKEDPEEERNFPFYKKDGDEYLIDVDYFRPPYPYIPLTCT